MRTRKRFYAFASSLSLIVVFLMNVTTPVPVEAVSSVNVSDVNGSDAAMQSWTWTEFGASVIGGAAGGAAAGAVAGAWACGVGAGPGAATGTVAGAVGGAVAYSAIQAYQAFFGGGDEAAALQQSVMRPYVAVAID